MRAQLFGFTLATLSAVSAATAAQVQFGYDLNEAKKQSARTGMPVMVMFLNGVNTQAGVWKFNTFKNDHVAEVSRRFIPIMLPGSSPLAHEFKVFGTVGFVFINLKGDVFEKFDGYVRDPEQFAEDLTRIADKSESSIIETLSADLASGRATSATAAAGMLASLKSADADKALAASVGKEEIPDAARKIMIDALGRRKTGATEVAPLLGHKNLTLRGAAATALIAMGPAGACAAFDGLSADDADMRVAAHKVVSTVTRYPKAGTSQFWKTGGADERAAALATWKEWWESHKPGAAAGTKLSKL